MANLESIYGSEHPVALVTGAGAARVGNAIALRLADMGFQLAIHFNQSEQGALQTVASIESQGGQAHSFQANLGDGQSEADLITQVVDRFSRLDVVVNSAAIWNAKSLEETTVADVEDHWRLNNLAVYLICQQAGLQMVGQDSGGAIINIGDWATIRPYLNYSAYFSAKGSVASITRSMAVELSSRNNRIRVNAVLPGPVMVPQSIVGDERQRIVDGTLLKREGSPDHVAHAVQFLVENDFVTGVAIPVDGGRTLA